MMPFSRHSPSRSGPSHCGQSSAWRRAQRAAPMVANRMKSRTFIRLSKGCTRARVNCAGTWRRTFCAREKTLDPRRAKSILHSLLMNDSNRRDFLKQTGALAAGAALVQSIPAARGASTSANEKVVLGIIGPGGMGLNLLQSFAAQKDVEIAYVSDVDAKRMADAGKAVENSGRKAPRAEKDFRKVLEDKSVDGVIIATPD